MTKGGFPVTAMKRFLEEFSVEDLALVSGQEEPPQYRHVHKSIKKKTFSQPKEIRACDLYIDLKASFKQGDYESATTYYYQLKRIIG